MKKIIQKTVFISLFFAGISLCAQDTINITDLGGAKITIYDSKYIIGSTTTTYSGPHVITGEYSLNSSSQNYILIYSGNYSDTTFIFDNLSLTNTSKYLIGTNDDDLTLNLKGYNYLYGYHAMYMGGSSLGTFNLKGDSLYANSIGYPVIGPQSSTIHKISIDCKYVYALTSATGYPAIGSSGSLCDSIVINNSTVTALGGTYGLGAKKIICINNSSVKGTLSRTAINAEGDTVYCVTMPHNGQLSIQMNDGSKDSTLTFYAHHPDDGNFYIYLPNGTYSFSNGDGYSYTAIVNGANTVATIPAIAGDGIIDVSPGEAIVVYDTMYTIGAQPYIFQGHKFTFTGSAITGGVTMYSKLADTLTFQNFSIEMEDGRAFSLQTGTDIALMLEGTNTLESTGTYAGLEKDSTAGTLTICGPDTLVATGSNGYGIGAKSGYTDVVASGNISITGGVIIASGAVGIGGASGGNMVISGGEVLATGNYTAIGNFKNLTVSGGKITAKSTVTSQQESYAPAFTATDTVAITGGIINVTSYNGPTLPVGITISGGTVFAQNKASTTYDDNGYSWAFRNGTFTGGTISIVGKDGKSTRIYHYHDYDNNAEIVQTDHPANSDSVLLYRYMYRVSGITEPALVESITINGTAWGSNDVYTDSTGTLYLWASEADTTVTTITIGGASYTYSGPTISYDNYVAPDEEEGIVEYGNYLWQVPVSIAAPENGSLIVTSGDSALTDGDYFCYKTELPLSITATPETGYLTDNIAVYGEKTTGDTTVTVADTIKIAAAFSLQYLTVEYTVTGNGSLAVSSETGSIETGASVGYGTELSVTATAEEGYQFDSMVINGIVSTTTDTTITVTGSVGITAYFNEIATGIGDFTIENTWVYSSDKTLYVHCAEDAGISVYSITGVLVARQQATGSSTAIPVQQSGIYILKITTATGTSVFLRCIVQ